MTALVWDKQEDRFYEQGVDRGVLYPLDGPGVAWQGLTQVSENTNIKVSSHYFDGQKSLDLVEIDSFSATISAFTYPDEFMEMEGLVSLVDGLYFGEQPPKVFGLSYRTMIGSHVEGPAAGYKIHLAYNLTATPLSKNYQTISEESDPVEFEWEITSVPENFISVRPTAHIVVDSRKFNPSLLNNLEDILYGTETTDPMLIHPAELSSFIDYA